MKDAEDCIKALSDESRMSILELLLRYNFCVGALANRLDISEAAVSQHLKTLREYGLVDGVKNGYFTHYEVNREKLVELSTHLMGLANMERLPCDPSMERCPIKKRCLCHADKKCMGCDCCKDCKNCHKTQTKEVD